MGLYVSSKSAEIQVSAFDANQKPVPGARVVLVPASRERTSLFESATANADGRVTIPGIEPGEYTLMAWEAIEDFAWLDEEVIKESEAFGKKLSIDESGRITTDIRVVPAR